MRRSFLLPILLLAIGCSSTPDVPVVATGGSLARERDAPSIGTGEEVPEPDLLDPNRVVARVNDQTITVRTIQAGFGDLLGTIRPGTPEQIRQALDYGTVRIIADRLFLEAARRMDVQITKEDLEDLRRRYEEEAKSRGTTLEEDLAARGIRMWEWEADQREMLLKSRWVQMALGQAQPQTPETRAEFDAYVRPAEVLAWYERHRGRFRDEEGAKLEGFLVSSAGFDRDMSRTREHAEALIRRARGGEDFEAVAKEAGGYVSMFREPLDREAAKSFTPEVGEFAWTAPVGSISDPIPTPSGFLVLKLFDRREARQRSFEEAREWVGDYLFKLKLDIGRLKLQLDLLEDSVITPRRYKEEIRRGLKAEIAKLLDELHG